jgi:hypothetical protein
MDRSALDRAICLATIWFNTGFAALTIITLCGIIFITKPKQVMHDIPPWAWLPLLIIIAPAQVYSLFLAWRIIGAGGTPTGPAIADAQMPYPDLLRPFIALAWTVNFVLGCGIVVSLSKPQGRPLALADVLILAVLSFWLTFAANVYLLLAVKALTDDKEMLQLVWRRRLIIDVAIVIFAAVYYHVLIA